MVWKYYRRAAKLEGGKLPDIGSTAYWDCGLGRTGSLHLSY
jgi:hypothetical protein